MRPADLLAWLRQAPFVPFRLCLNSGRTYEIRHPEMLRVGRYERKHLFVCRSAGGSLRTHGNDLVVLIERIEPIETAIPA